MSSKLSVTKIKTHVPDLQEIKRVFSDGLPKNFSNVDVDVVDCPDLTEPPFYLSSQGLCGKPRLADVGGKQYLVPLVQMDKIYNHREVAELSELPDAFIIGAGAGPAHVVGSNCELITNMKYENGKVINNTCTTKMDVSSGGYITEKSNTEEFCFLGNFLLSEGKPGKVVEVKVTKRVGEENFVSCLKNILKSQYGDKPIGLGGVFLVEKGTVYTHIMPDFSTTPLNTRDEVFKWLKFFEMKAPLVCVGDLISHVPGYSLLDEHFHCFGNHGEGGHFFWTTTPEEVVYRGYFVLAEYIYRIDQPPNTD